MTRFEYCVDKVLAREGGLVNDPNDPGGLTKFGISQRQYPTLDIASLTREDAVAIYFRDYWQPSRAASLPPPLDLYLFDGAVNQGIGPSVRRLQLAVGAVQDGVIGPHTLYAIDQLGVVEAGALFMATRAMAYASLPTFQRFGRGWLKRLFIVAAEGSHQPQETS